MITLIVLGIKVANIGEWIRHKWNVRRGYLKIHVAVDIKNKKIISLEVTTSDYEKNSIAITRDRMF